MTTTADAPAPVETTAPAPSTTEAQPIAPDTLNIDELTREVLAEVNGEPTTGTPDEIDVEAHLDRVLPPRDPETGKFTKAEGTDDSGAAEVTTEGAASSVEEGAEPAPDGEAEPATNDAAPKAALPFKVYAADGTETDAPAVEVEFTADGKTMRKPLADVVRLAQRGRHNERLHEEVEAARTFRDVELPRLQADYQQAQAFAHLLLTNDDALEQARAEFAQFHTPEARAERAEAQLEAERQRLASLEQQRTTEQAAHHTREFLATDVVPAVLAMVQQYPTVTEDEVTGRVVAAAKHYLVDGVIPPQALAKVAAAMEDVRLWAEGTHETRTESQRAREAAEAAKREAEAARAQAEQAKREATKLKRDTARVLKPTGAATMDTPRPAKPRTADEAIAQTIAKYS